MEDNKQGSIMSDNYSMTISQDNTNKEILLSREDEMKSIASQNFIEKNEIEQKADYTNELSQNTNNNEIKENKEYPLIEKLLNIQKLIKKELSTRKICK